MAKYVFVVMTNAVEGQEDEFNAWYDNQHIGDVLKVEGFKAAQRFRLAPAEADNPKAVHRYLAIYEVETDDLAKTQAALGAAIGTPAMPLTGALEVRKTFSVYYEPIGEKVTAARAAPAAALAQ